MGTYIESLRTWLLERGYTPGSIKHVLTLAGQLGRWMECSGSPRPAATADRAGECNLLPAQPLLHHGEIGDLRVRIVMAWKTCVGAALLAMASVGCGEGTSGGEVGDSLAAGSPPPVWVEPSCPDQLPEAATARGGIPDDFVTSWVLRCRSDVRDVPGDGSWQMDVAERADTPASELVDQLRRESEPRSNGPCPAMQPVLPYFALVDPTGRALLPVIPTDGCGMPREQAIEAVEALPFQVLSETPVRRLESQEAIDSGCSQSWKDLLVVEAGRATPGPATRLWPAPVDVLRVCVYDAGPGADDPVGQFTSGRMLTGDAATALADALHRAGPAVDCSTPHSRFAVVTLERAGQWAVAALDGCRHLLRPDNTLGQLDENAIALLLG